MHTPIEQDESNRLSNELPLDFNAPNDALHAEYRASGKNDPSHKRKKSTGYYVVLALIFICTPAATIFLINGTKGSEIKKSSETNAQKNESIVAQQSSEMIDTAKSHLTESSIRKLIEENTRPADVTQSTERLSNVEAVLATLQEGQVKQLEMLGELKAVSDSLKTQVAAHESAIASLGKRFESNARPVVIQRDAASFSEAKPRVRKAPDVVKVAAPVVVEFPPVRLVSIKNFNGKSAATLILNGEASGLVMVGQTWRGFMLIAADSTQRNAIIGRDGQVKTLSL